MKNCTKLSIAGVAVLVGALMYDRYRSNKPSEKETAIRRHKNRHLNPVFSKIKDLQETATEE